MFLGDDEYIPEASEAVESPCSSTNSSEEEVEIKNTPVRKSRKPAIAQPTSANGGKRAKTPTTANGGRKSKTPTEATKTPTIANGGRTSPTITPRSLGSCFYSLPSPLTPASSLLGDREGSFHEKLDWLKEDNRKDKSGRRRGHPEFNPRTLQVQYVS